jgi:glycosyltransferase involved in cell wall biosynthesis
MNLSVIVPAYNAEATLPALLDSFSNQSNNEFEVVVIDDASHDRTSQVARSYPCEVITLSENRGPAYCRNIGAKKARGEVLAFTDSDCRVARDWVANIHRHFFQNDTEAIMGRLVLMPSTLLGDSISALGYPAGGAIGFEKIWKVNSNGFTDSFSSCNCAIRKDIFDRAGGFDDSFPYPGGEDSLLAYNLRELNYRIKYCPNVLAYHEARSSLTGFLHWQFRRGISSYIFSTKVSKKKKFLSLRFWSTGNIVRHYYTDKKFPIIFVLLGMSVLIQFMGFLFGKYNRGYLAGSDHKSAMAG